MNILVFGAGPLGSLMAARLYEAGHDVTVLARGQRLTDILERGIVIRADGSDELEIARVKSVERFGPNDAYDLVMLGFPLPGGHREGHLIEVVPVDEGHVWTIPLGEVDGRITERTRSVAAVLGSMRGYKVQLRRDMDAWLRHHVALLMPALAPTLYAAGISMKRMGRTRDLNVLAVRGMREAIRGLRKTGVPITPAALKVLFVIPEPLLVALFARMMKTEKNRASIEGHPKNARDELRYLTEEFLGFLKERGIKTPVCDSLFAYYDPQTPLMPDGSRTIALRWRGVVFIILAAVAATVAMVA